MFNSRFMVAALSVSLLAAVPARALDDWAGKIIHRELG